jgi:hypothetical protein
MQKNGVQLEGITGRFGRRVCPLLCRPCYRDRRRSPGGPGRPGHKEPRATQRLNDNKGRACSPFLVHRLYRRKSTRRSFDQHHSFLSLHTGFASP